MVETEETSLSNMSATCSPFRRPKGKGGTKSGINLVHGTIGIENGQHSGGARHNFNTERQHNHFAQVGVIYVVALDVIRS